jgi:hypothetical protein
MGNGKHKPGPTGLHAKGGGTATAPSMADQIVGYARRQSGTRVGDGECFTLTDRALQAAHAKSARDYGTVTPTADYTWGAATTLANLQPGDVVQFRDYSYTREDVTANSRGTRTVERTEGRPHHTAIVQSVDGNGAVTVLEQNSPAGSGVRRTQLFFTSRSSKSGDTTTTITVSGTFWFYRPEAR